MKRKLALLYAIISTLLLAAGFLLVFYFSWNAGVWETVDCIIGLVLGFVLSPVLHELGHVSFARMADMEYVYVKMFCFRVKVQNGKKKFSFASPFAPDETQVLPLRGGNMEKRAKLYTLGGIIFGGAFLLVVLGCAVVLTCMGYTDYQLWGMVPYATYLFFLNALPFEYAGGKTDMLVYLGIRKGEAAERNMIAAMEIHGQLSEGKSFAEIDERYYYDVPQLCEDEPLFAVMLDLRYRYHLEKEEIEKAANCLNRLVGIQEYLSASENEKIAAELVYVHSLCKDKESAEACGKCCKEYLKEDTATSKRILAAYSATLENFDTLEILLQQAKQALMNEPIKGVRKFEQKLIERISMV